MTRAEALDFRERAADWIEDWIAFAGSDALADQVRFDREWAALRAYAAERGVKLIGDIPIYVAEGSADQLAHPEIFKAGAVAGVPPDAFTDKGQLWGNPLYDWPALRRAGLRAGGSRASGASFELFDLARIDHFRGFVAYWAVPADAEFALSGAWKRGPGRAPFDAAREALGELPLIAEDLGVITPPVDAPARVARPARDVRAAVRLHAVRAAHRARPGEQLGEPGRLHRHARQRHDPRLVRVAGRRAARDGRRHASGASASPTPSRTGR